VHVVPVFWNQRVALKPADTEYVPFGGLMEARSWIGRHVCGNVVCFAAALAGVTERRAIASSALVTTVITNSLCCWWRANDKVDPSKLVGVGYDRPIDAIIVQFASEGLQTWGSGRRRS
jgi:hypothetical protein